MNEKGHFKFLNSFAINKEILETKMAEAFNDTKENKSSQVTICDNALDSVSGGEKKNSQKRTGKTALHSQTITINNKIDNNTHNYSYTYNVQLNNPHSYSISTSSNNNELIIDVCLTADEDDLIISDKQTINRLVNGDVIIQKGGNLKLSGSVNGDVIVEEFGQLELRGSVNGDLIIDKNTMVVCAGVVNGDVENNVGIC